MPVDNVGRIPQAGYSKRVEYWTGLSTADNAHHSSLAHGWSHHLFLVLFLVVFLESACRGGSEKSSFATYLVKIFDHFQCSEKFGARVHNN